MKTECEKYRDWLAQDDAGETEREELKAHLSGCPDCAALASFLAEVESELSAMPDTTPDIVGSVMKVVRRSALTASPSLAYRQQTKGAGITLWPLAGAAALFALIMAGLGAYIAFGGGDVQLIDAVAAVNIKTIAVFGSVIGSLAVAVMAFIYSRMVSVA